MRPLEEVVVLEQVALVGQHLLDPQRPLLVPRPRQAERLVPRGQLHGAGAGVLGQRHGEHLEHDALHVVLGLGLGEPERVDLHAVAEAALLGVGDAVALEGQLVPELHEGAHLAHLLDEAHAGVDEERDPGDDLAEALRRHLAGVAHGIQHGDRGAHRVGDLLHRRRAGLLQVVAADVDRVPLRDLGDGVGDHVGDQPQRRGRARRRRCPRDRYSLMMSFWVVPASARTADAGSSPAASRLLLGGHLVEREQPHRGGVDRHRGVHPRQRDVGEQGAHVADVRDRHADLADLAAGQHVVGVVAGLGRQVERDREAGLALVEVAAVQRVARGGAGVTGVRAHHPRAVALGACDIGALGHAVNASRGARGRGSDPHGESAHTTGPSRRTPGRRGSARPVSPRRRPGPARPTAAGHGTLSSECSRARRSSRRVRSSAATMRIGRPARRARRWHSTIRPKPVASPTWASPRSSSTGVRAVRDEPVQRQPQVGDRAHVEPPPQRHVAPPVVLVLGDGHDGIPLIGHGAPSHVVVGPLDRLRRRPRHPPTGKDRAKNGQCPLHATTSAGCRRLRGCAHGQPHPDLHPHRRRRHAPRWATSAAPARPTRGSRPTPTPTRRTPPSASPSPAATCPRTCARC